MTLANSELRIPNYDRGRVVGLVGGIGSGKSQVAMAFARRGALVIAGDELAHAALRQPEIKARVFERWGPELIDEGGEIQRRRLASIVFADAAERRALEELVHPWIRARIRHAVAAARHDPAVKLIVLDAAVMLEAGWNEICDSLVFVDAPPEERQRRVAGQRGWTAQDLAAREKAQLPLTAKAARADHVLDNSGTLEHLERQVDDLLRGWDLVPAAATARPSSP